MPLLAVAAILLFLVLFTVVMLPLSLILRFRASSTRRRAWGWVVTLNLVAALISSAVLLVTAAVSNAWIPNAFRYSLYGLACGFALGLVGLAATRWETTPQGLHYKPNRWLILLLTLVVTARILYGFWRVWHAWQTTPAGESWLASSGAAGSMGAGAAVLGYYVLFWAGLRRKVRRHRLITMAEMTKRGFFLLLVVACAMAPSAFAQQAAANPPMARTIILVRHGAYQADPANPSPGPGLLPVGVAQAKLAASRLAAMGKFDAVLSSPMTRAQETARVIAADLSNGPVQIVPELEECTPPTRRKEATRNDSAESLAKCKAQFDALFAQRFVPAAGSPRREIFVAHGNVIRSMVVRALGVDPEAWLEMSIAHCSITEILVEPDGRFRVISVGDAGHLPVNLQSGVTGVSDKSLTVPR